MCLRLDSELGLYTRRLAYVQLFNEKMSVISILLGEKFRWAYNPNDIRSRLISPFVACFMIARYRLHRIGEEHIREKTERILLEIVDRLRTHDYLIGEQFSAADLTFCSLVKPAMHVSYFHDDPRFQVIFDYHEQIRQNKIYAPSTDEQETLEFKIPSSSYNEQQPREAFNDQRITNNQSIWSMVTFLVRYLCHLYFTIPGQAAHLK
ncbi:unnamed protein product [Rotaria sp. Silwood2]|nr:unnamed protein product [Rotaria sp. Silwood2]CAF4364347.1 unnamed protein product [Rotaria sp. Silwood2]CAF4532184.1 unnamed protein product [Rotaria sp. Silwood2]